MDEQKTAAFRPLQDNERRLLETLLDHHQFNGRDQFREQLESTAARLILEHQDNYGSIRLHVSNGPPSSGRYRVPVEGQYLDDDGIPVWLLLHINREGFMCELEIVRRMATPSFLLRHPSVLRFTDNAGIQLRARNRVIVH